jgi:hypothetical protein
MSRTVSPARRPLADLNASFRTTGSSEDFETVTEYRVGRWGLAYGRDGFGVSSQGGEKLHLSVVTAITAIHDGYNWQPYCVASNARRFQTAEQVARDAAQAIANHGKPWHHCSQPKVGDVLYVSPVCRDNNVRGKAAFTPEIADTDVISCTNCLRHFFGETIDVVRIKAEEKAAIAARKAAKPLPARCFHCGQIRPQTKATLAGEKLPCSSCEDDLETIFWVETTGCYCDYHAEVLAESPERTDLVTLGIEKENQAYESLVRHEGKYL